MNPVNEPKYSIGTQFKNRGDKHRIFTVTDVYRTYNSAGDLVKVSYQAKSNVTGAIDYDVLEIRISMGLLAEVAA